MGRCVWVSFPYVTTSVPSTAVQGQDWNSWAEINPVTNEWEIQVEYDGSTIPYGTGIYAVTKATVDEFSNGSVLVP